MRDPNGDGAQKLLSASPQRPILRFWREQRLIASDYSNNSDDTEEDDDTAEEHTV